MTTEQVGTDKAKSLWAPSRWRLSSDAVITWSLFWACYWLYPLWPRGLVSWDLKFAVLAVYTVGFLVVLGWLSRSGHEAAEIPISHSWWSEYSTPWGLASVAALLGAAVFQFRETLEPILSGPDEPYVIAAALDQWQAITASGTGLVRTSLALGSAIPLWFGGLLLLSKVKPFVARVVVGCGLLIVGFALNYETMLAVAPRWGESPRWPPLGTLAEVLSLSVLGPSEASARLPSLFFFLMTAVVMFRMVAREAAPALGFVALVSLLSSPAFFTQGQLASRETAGAFFMTAAAYFVVRRWHFGRDGDLGWSVAMTLAAYLTRRPAIVFAVVIFGVEAVRLWRQRRAGGLREIAAAAVHPGLAFVVLVAGAFPWMFSTRTIRPFELSPLNWLDWRLFSAYPSQFPVAMGLVVMALGTAGMVTAIVRRRILTSLALLWLVVVYVLFTSDIPRWIPTWRFLALMCPAWAVLAAEGFRCLSDRLPGWARPAVVVVLVIGAAFSFLTWWSCDVSLARPSKAPCRSRMPRYPFDQVVAWVEATQTGAVVITPATYWQTALDVYAIFDGVERIDEYVPPYGSPAPPLELRDVREICRSTRIDFVVVPYQRVAEQWVPKFMKPEEAVRLTSELRPASGELVTFTRGSYRLEVYPCPPD